MASLSLNPSPFFPSSAREGGSAVLRGDGEGGLGGIGGIGGLGGIGAAGGEGRPRPAPWVEKFRPRTIDDIAHQEEVVSALRGTISSGDLPNLLFHGPPGTGKTSAILAVARQLWGPGGMRSRVLELNASDERGIDVVRNKIKTFARRAVGGGSAAGGGEGHPCPPFKLIVLDEADSMTDDAQSALRRIMEFHSSSTRFCIICNCVTRIIEPIVSRCARFRFRALPPGAMAARLAQIVAAEGVRLQDAAAVHAAITEVTSGDLRRGVTLLQSCCRLHGPHTTPAHVRDAAAVVPDEEIKRLMYSCHHGSQLDVEACVLDVLAKGFPALHVVARLSEIACTAALDPFLDPRSHAAICRKLAVADERLNKDADEFLQLCDVAFYLHLLFHRKATPMSSRGGSWP